MIPVLLTSQSLRYQKMAVHTAAHHSAGQVLPFRESLMAMLGICFVTMLVALDQTVVGTALPTIVAELIITCHRRRTTESGKRSAMQANAVPTSMPPPMP